jgi:hypothetical protein
MSIQSINTGTSANAGNGDSLRLAFTKVNANFGYIEDQIRFISTSTGSTVTVVGEAPPASPITGALWYDTINETLFVYYGDAWIEANPPNAIKGYTGSAGRGSTGYLGSVGYAGSRGIGYVGSQGTVGYTGSIGVINQLSSSTGATVTLKDVSAVPELELSPGTFLYFEPSSGQDPNFGGLQLGLSGPKDPDGNTASSLLSIGSDFIIGVLESPSSGHFWVFDTASNLTLPQGGNILNYDGSPFTSAGVGYTGSASTVRGYAGSAGLGFTGSSGSLGYTGSFGAGYDQDLYTTSSVTFHEITLQNTDEGNAGNTIVFGDGNHEIVARDGGNSFSF